jgi:hypothetical protein
MRKWHTKKCAEWNRNNRRCAQENYLHDKLAQAVGKSDVTKKTSAAVTTLLPPVSTSHAASFPQLPRCLVQEVIGAQQLVIMEYIARQLFRAVQEVINRQALENSRNSS